MVGASQILLTHLHVLVVELTFLLFNAVIVIRNRSEKSLPMHLDWSVSVYTHNCGSPAGTP